ncbi:MAG: hypothetical protein ACRCSN_14715 [Dermatophilaceae bacterium]
MREPLSHEEIATRFLESGALDFDAVGKFITKVGPELVANDDGFHGVFFGRFNMINCMLSADDLRDVFRGIGGGAGLAEAVDLPNR